VHRGGTAYLLHRFLPRRLFHDFSKQKDRSHRYDSIHPTTRMQIKDLEWIRIVCTLEQKIQHELEDTGAQDCHGPIEDIRDPVFHGLNHENNPRCIGTEMNQDAQKNQGNTRETRHGSHEGFRIGLIRVIHHVQDRYTSTCDRQTHT
jgi:hypothetical protein